MVNKNSEKVKQWQRDNPAAYLAKNRAWNLRNKYGVTLEQYSEMLAEQGGVCKICHNPNYTKSLAVDHCHSTGKIRGLLCHSCNNFLGIYERNRDRFEVYLKENG